MQKDNDAYTNIIFQNINVIEILCLESPVIRGDNREILFLTVMALKELLEKADRDYIHLFRFLLFLSLMIVDLSPSYSRGRAQFKLQCRQCCVN